LQRGHLRGGFSPAPVHGRPRGARGGILIKGGIHLETLAKVRTVAFDKTGTLTAGQPVLTDLIPLGGHGPQTVLGLAAAVEAASDHPLATAIVSAATRHGLAVIPATDGRATLGIGVEGTTDGHRVSVGRPDPDSLPVPAGERLAALQNDGKTVVLVTVDGESAGLLGIADQLRPEAAGTRFGNNSISVAPDGAAEAVSDQPSTTLTSIRSSSAASSASSPARSRAARSSSTR
jgi:cation transport ATPase